MATLRITQVKSSSGAGPRHRATLQTLGLGRIGSTCEREDRPELAGALRAVGHLVKVEGR
jgi:large subunit ribosomal protein L30